MTAHIIRNKKYGNSGRPDSPDIDTLKVEIRYHTAHMLQFKVRLCLLSSVLLSVFSRLKHSLHLQIWDPATNRYEVPVPLSVPVTPETDESKRLYKVVITQNPFGIQVIRKSTGTKMWVGDGDEARCSGYFLTELDISNFLSCHNTLHWCFQVFVSIGLTSICFCLLFIKNK